MQVIIFLYLIEENTSYLVLFSSGLGLIIEFWKLTQAMSISVDLVRRLPQAQICRQEQLLREPPFCTPMCTCPLMRGL